MATELFSHFGTVKVGSTSKLIEIVLNGTLNLFSDYTCWYIREGAGSGGSVTLQTMSAGTWATGGLVKVNGDVFQFGVPDAALATGVRAVTFRFKDSSDNKWMYRIELPAYDITDAVRLGLSALPNAAPAAVGGLPTVDASNQIAGIQGTLNTLDDLENIDAAGVEAAADASLATVGLTTTITGRVDAAISTRATPAQVNTECDTALADYDAPTRTELTADKDEIIASVESESLTVQNLVTDETNEIDADIIEMDAYLVAIKIQTDKLPDNPASTADVINDAPNGGADQVTLNVTAGTVPVADAQVWVTTDISGLNTVAGPSNTDSNGNVLFLLDDGASYYMWAQKDGIISITGELFIAEAD